MLAKFLLVVPMVAFALVAFSARPADADAPGPAGKACFEKCKARANSYGEACGRQCKSACTKEGDACDDCLDACMQPHERELLACFKNCNWTPPSDE